MRLLTTQKYPFTVDLFDFTTDGTTNTYFASGSMKVNVLGDPMKGLRIYSTGPLKAHLRLNNLQDVDGEIVFPLDGNDAGVTWEVYNSLPVMNPYGKREYFTSYAKAV